MDSVWREEIHGEVTPITPIAKLHTRHSRPDSTVFSLATYLIFYTGSVVPSLNISLDNDSTSHNLVGIVRLLAGKQRNAARESTGRLSWQKAVNAGSHCEDQRQQEVHLLEHGRFVFSKIQL